jgi:hypothetical protein
MATLLSVGDIAIVQYNSSTTDSFTFVFTRDVEAGTVVNFTDNGWLAAGGDSRRAKERHLHGGRRGYRQYDRHADRAQPR